MAVVGIDLGSYSSYVGVARAGGIETIDNEYSSRLTPTYISFNEKSRTIGVAAKQQSVTNFKNTVTGFTRIVGRKFDDPHVQKELTGYFRPNEVGADKSGCPVLQVWVHGRSLYPRVLLGVGVTSCDLSVAMLRWEARVPQDVLTALITVKPLNNTNNVTVAMEIRKVWDHGRSLYPRVLLGVGVTSCDLSVAMLRWEARVPQDVLTALITVESILRDHVTVAMEIRKVWDHGRSLYPRVLLGVGVTSCDLSVATSRWEARVPQDVLTALITLNYMGEKQSFSPQQLTGMMLTKLRDISETALKTKVVDVVLSVPTFFTDAERRALLDCCEMAGLNCLRLMNDTTAAALAYGIYKQDLPAETDKPRNVIILDFGYSSIQAAGCSFNKGKLKVVATAANAALGGRNFDELLMKVFAAEFNKKHRTDVEAKPKAYIRLLQECEKLKKLMSANTQNIPINIECLVDDWDLHSKMDRERFEELSADLIERIKSLLEEILEKSQWKTSDVYSVEVVGGSSRIPAFKKLVKTVFGKEASTTLNSDEATARGCALQCAILSPTFRVRDFHVSNSQPYPITLRWEGTIDEDSSLEVFPENHTSPFSKMLTFYRKEPFTLSARYTYPNNIPFNTPEIGTFTIDKVVPQANGDSSKVKVKVRIDSNGIFRISQATLVEKLVDEEVSEQMDVNEEKKNGDSNSTVEDENKEPVPTPGEDPPMDTDEATPTENNAENSTEELPTTPSSDDKPAEGDDKKEKPAKKPKKATRTVELPVQSRVPQMTKEELNLYIEKENQMIMQDKLEKQRADAKNALEEYVYDMRDKLGSVLEEFAKEEDRTHLSKLLEQTEEWLYDEGDDQMKQVYVEKLASLKKLGQPIIDRQREFTERPQALNDLGTSLQHVRKFLDQWEHKDERYIHIDKADVEKVHRCYKENMQWYETKMNHINNAKPYEDPVVLVVQIRQQRQSLESTVSPIMSKPKPKVEPPKDIKKDEKAEEKKEDKTASGDAEKMEGDVPGVAKSPEQQAESKPEMDVD